MNLLSTNRKLEKGEKFGYLTAGLALSPGGWRCPFHSRCLKSCIGLHAGMNSLQRNRDIKAERTRFLDKDPKGFMDQLVDEIESARRKAKRKGLKLAVRLNTYSDLAWEKPLTQDTMTQFPFGAFKDVQFYDYTKDWRRIDTWAKGDNPKNYYLNWSHDGTRKDWANVWKAYRAGMNPVFVVAGVKKDESFPTRWLGKKVIDGDRHDLRFEDGKGLVMLRVKGKPTDIAIDINDPEVKKAARDYWEITK